jgi:antitoxin FitA
MSSVGEAWMNMLLTCQHVMRMKMIQIRNVPDDLHRARKLRAAREGRTLSDLILSDLPRLADKPSAEDVMTRIRSRTPVGGSPASELIAAERDRR